MGVRQLDRLDAALRTIRAERVAGDLVECGPGRGGAAVYMRGFLDAFDVADATVWVAGDFRSAPASRAPRPLAEGGIADLLADLNQVRDAFQSFGLLDDRVRFLQGAFRDALADGPTGAIALVRIGAGVGADAGAVLETLYDRVAHGGYVLVEDTADDACREAVEKFRARRNIAAPIERIGWSGLLWRKDATAELARAEAPASGGNRAPVAPPAPADVIDLSVVVVFYNMQREARRTLHSLSRAYQRDIDDLDYEVIVVENGSAPDQRLGADFVQGFGPEFRYLDMGDSAQPSPTNALNRAIAVARGKSLALMIDGAHVLTPGVLKFGVAGLRCYEPAVVATQHWYVGPGQQPVVVDQGYDEQREDALFSEIEWPADGYRLFQIGHFIGERDWFDGILESNCLFVPRALLEQAGGFDESFSMPGGGYANLDLWERLGSAPGVTTVTILGEGSFHQLHGGVTTNDGAQTDRRKKIFAYGEHYEELRGRLLRGPTKGMHYVGNLAAEGSRRTRSRRLTNSAFTTGRTQDGPDGIPEIAEPMPDELRTTLVETYWRTLSWQHSTWLGRPVTAAPTDLLVYQELVTSVRPEWIVHVGVPDDGRAWFFATICDLLGQGRVVSVTDGRGPQIEHPRISYVSGEAHEDRTIAAVRALTGERPSALVVLGSQKRAPRLVAEFTALAPLVPVGSYVVVENTMVNGHPVWPGYGPGPAEAVRRILALNGDFVQDTEPEHGLTFNAGGYLRRLR
jgi:cephalosporin hydroxylase